MRTLRIGSMEVLRVAEIDRLAFDATWLFANADLDVIRQSTDWLDARFVEPGTDRLVLSFHSYVIRAAGRTILVDTCNGNDKDRPSLPAWHQLHQPYLETLAAAGVRPEHVDVVLCTHLHADHVGWNTRLENGRWVPTFPNAEYVMARAEFEHWHQKHRARPEQPVNRGSFADSVLPVFEAGQVVMVGMDHVLRAELDETIALEPAPGHTPGNVNVHVRARDGHAVLSGDVIHHPVQFAAPWLSNHADFDAGLAHRVRLALMRSCADTDTVLLAGHFAAPTAGRVVTRGDAFRFRFLDA